MRAPSILRTLVIGGLASGLVSAPISSANAQKLVRWKMQSVWGSRLPHYGTSAVRFTKNVEAMSGGTLRIEFFEPRALVPTGECFDAVSKGVIESCWAPAGYHSRRYPALAFFSAAVPFGARVGEFLAWKWFGGGNKLKDEIYAKHNLIAFDGVAVGPETSGWFRDEITSVDQLKGLKMRFVGLAGKVMQKFGASTHPLLPTEIYPALERGVLDAVEVSMPSIDITLGFHKIVKNNYYPGWHHPIAVGELLMNRDAWNKLSEQHKAIIRVALRENVIHSYVETEAKNFGAMQEMTSKHGVTIQRWSDEILRLFEKAWREVVEEESARDPLFKRVADSYFRFREQYRMWGDAQFLKSTYLDE